MFNRLSRILGPAIALSFGLMLPTPPSATAQATPPKQPNHGPGGRDYVHRGFQIEYHEEGSEAEAFWIFQPKKPLPTSPTPVVVLVHGWSYTPPQSYAYWLAHMVARGNTVIYPVYRGRFTSFSRVTENALIGVKAAFAELARPGHSPIDTDRFAIAGHSIGAMAAANLAHLAASEGLPEPRALLTISPYVSGLLSLSDIPSTCLALITEGVDDETVDPDDPRLIWSRLQHIPEDSRDFLTYPSDDHGAPPIITSHNYCTAYLGSPDQLGALEFYGTWKLFDALMNAAFYGEDREYALGNTPQQRWMGRWSDGVAVREPTVTDNP